MEPDHEHLESPLILDSYSYYSEKILNQYKFLNVVTFALSRQDFVHFNLFLSFPGTAVDFSKNTYKVQHSTRSKYIENSDRSNKKIKKF